MKLFKPQVYLSKSLNGNGNYQYFLLAVTYCESTKYISGGNEPFNGVPDANGAYHVQLNLDTQTDVVMELFRPVVHTLELGEIFQNGNAAKIEVSVVHEGRELGKTIIDNDEAEDDGKPTPEL